MIMRVIENVFSGIDNNQSLSLQSSHSEALHELMMGYNEIAISTHNGHSGLDYAEPLPLISGVMCGADLKHHLAIIRPDDLLRLMGMYLATQSKDHDHDHESQADQEERQLKHWLIKTGVIFCLALFFVIIGAMLAITHYNKALPDNAVFKTILDTASEILKILFNSHPK